MNPQTELEKRYPAADFSIYFAFIDLCRQFEPEPKAGLTQEHHICPKKQFPEHEHAPENLITLYTPLHQHAHNLLHTAESELWAASKWIGCAAKGGRRGGRKIKELGIGIFAPENRGKGGRIGGRKSIERFASYRTPDHQSKAGKLGGVIGGKISTHKRWHVNRNIVSPTCALCSNRERTTANVDRVWHDSACGSLSVRLCSDV